MAPVACIQKIAIAPLAQLLIVYHVGDAQMRDNLEKMHPSAGCTQMRDNLYEHFQALWQHICIALPSAHSQLLVKRVGELEAPPYHKECEVFFSSAPVHWGDPVLKVGNFSTYISHAIMHLSTGIFVFQE
eukprot:951223-Ditylum_brightwellii.AAC.1